MREELDGLRAAAGEAYGADVEDAALLKRLVLKRCVYGVDLSPMGAEIAKVSLWLATFVPGLSLAYLDHNVRVGNSLIGVARPEEVADAAGGRRPGADVRRRSQRGDRRRRQGGGELQQIPDRTPDEVKRSQKARGAGEQVEGVRASSTCGPRSRWA